MKQPLIDARDASPGEQHPTDSRPELLTMPEACDALRISKWSLYRLIQERKLATIKIGARRLVAREDLRELVNQLRSEGDGDGR